MHPRAHYDVPLPPQHNVHAGAEFDQTHSFASSDSVARFLIADDAPCNQTRNLAENYPRAVSFHGECILLVLGRSALFAGHQKPAFPITHVADHPPDGRAVYMYIEDVEKNADTRLRPVFLADSHHLSVRR